jgi:hypothetical protein
MTWKTPFPIIKRQFRKPQIRIRRPGQLTRLRYLALNRTWVVCRQPLVSTKLEKFRARGSRPCKRLYACLVSVHVLLNAQSGDTMEQIPFERSTTNTSPAPENRARGRATSSDYRDRFRFLIVRRKRVIGCRIGSELCASAQEERAGEQRKRVGDINHNYRRQT